MMTSSRCPICHKQTVESYAPFCSRRCAMVDLNNWLVGNYRIETDEPPDTPFDPLEIESLNN